MIIEISKAKANLSKLIEMVNHGQKVTIIKNNKPVADLVIHKPQGIRKLGLLRGKLFIPDNFSDESEEINSMFYGKEK